MSIYKKGINSLESVKNVEFTMSNNSGIYMNQTVIGENTAPYHGLFIKQEENKDELYLSKIIEQIKIDGQVFNISDIVTNEEKYGGSEFLQEFNRYDEPCFKYIVGDNLLTIDKKYIFCMDKNVLCIEYDIQNLGNKVANIKMLPLVTKRNLFTSKRESMLKLNSDVLKQGFKVTLSITENKFLYLQSSAAKVKSKPHYINGVRYDYEISASESKLYLEDLYVPGHFEVDVKGKAKTNVKIYVSCENIDISEKEFNVSSLKEKQLEKYKMVTGLIDESFFELKSLAISASELNYIDNVNRRFVLLRSLPNIQINMDNLKQIIQSINGNYILLGKYKEAYRILESIKYRLEKEKQEYTKQNYYETLFIYIEALNRYMNCEGASDDEKAHIREYINEKVREVLNAQNEEKIYNSDFIINIEGKSYLLINIYWYNTLKIYLSNILDANLVSRIYSIVEKLKEKLTKKFFDEQNKVLKYELHEQPYASADMLVAMDLSNPLVHDDIAMKIIDTAFKELYTPYGIRKFSQKSGKHDGYVYPHLMAAFVNANLRQNGITRATQKIAYNLVKELLQEINKKTIGSIKYKYDEKTKKAYGMPVNSLTNGEIIRLYNMLI